MSEIYYTFRTSACPKNAAYFGLAYFLQGRNLASARIKPDRQNSLACLLSGLFGTTGDEGLQGHVILARGFAKVGVEGVIADRQGEVVRTGVFVLLLPDATAFDQFAARGWTDDGRQKRCVRLLDRLPPRPAGRAEKPPHHQKHASV